MKLFDMFHAGGWPMYPILVAGVLFMAAVARSAYSPARRHLPLVLMLGALTLLLGLTGTVLGMIHAFTGLADAGEMRGALALIGLGESLNDLALALSLLCVGAGIGAVGGARVTLDTTA